MMRNGVDVFPALTFRQPWAWAVVFGGKDLENRDRRTSIRGRIVIHAAAAKSEQNEAEYYRDAVTWMVSRGLARSEEWPSMMPAELEIAELRALPLIPKRARLPVGVLYGTTEIVDVIDRDVEPDRGANRWKMFERYAYRLRETRPCIQRPWAGKPGWFYVPSSEVVGAKSDLRTLFPATYPGTAPSGALRVMCAKCKAPAKLVTVSEAAFEEEIRIYAKCHGDETTRRLTDAELQAADGGKPISIEVFRWQS